MNILLIERDSRDAARIARALHEAGHDIDHAADGKSGLLRAASRPYGIIIWDRSLPVAGGRALLKTISTNGCLTPVIMLDGSREGEECIRGFRESGDEYLVRPVAL